MRCWREDCRSEPSPRWLEPKAQVLALEEASLGRDGEFVRVARCNIARQWLGTAKGFIFISMEDETSIANVIVAPDL